MQLQWQVRLKWFNYSSKKHALFFPSFLGTSVGGCYRASERAPKRMGEKQHEREREIMRRGNTETGEKTLRKMNCQNSTDWAARCSVSPSAHIEADRRHQVKHSLYTYSINYDSRYVNETNPLMDELGRQLRFLLLCVFKSILIQIKNVHHCFPQPKVVIQNEEINRLSQGETQYLTFLVSVTTLVQIKMSKNALIGLQRKLGILGSPGINHNNFRRFQVNSNLKDFL